MASSSINIGKNERAVSLAGGASLLAAALLKRGTGGLLLGLLGGALLYRGASGHCHMKAAMNKETDDDNVEELSSDSTKDVPGHGGILVTNNITIGKSPDELYAFWRKLENLPQFMDHLQSVEEKDETHSHWVAKAPAGTSVSWDAEIIRDEPGHYIAWRSTEDSTVPNSGSVRFVPAPQGMGTEVKVNLEYQPPGGKLGALVAKLFGEEPQQQIDDDMRRFKQLMETGEITTNGRTGRTEETGT